MICDLWLSGTGNWKVYGDQQFDFEEIRTMPWQQCFLQSFQQRNQTPPRNPKITKVITAKSKQGWYPFLFLKLVIHTVNIN